MRITNHLKCCGDDKDGCTIELSREEFDVFNKVFNKVLTYNRLKEAGFDEEEIRIGFAFCTLY